MKKELGLDIDVELIAGTNGVFEVFVDNRLVFSKKQQGRFPEGSEIISLVR